MRVIKNAVNKDQLINGVAILRFDSLTIGIGDLSQQEQFSIQPNPAVNFFDYNLNNENVADLEIRNSNGDLVLEENHLQSYGRIDISGLTPGLYFITLKQRKAIFHRRLVKIE